MTRLTFEKALKLSGLTPEKGSMLTPPQKKFLIESTQNLVDRNGEEWMLGNKGRLAQELEIVFNEI